MNFRTPSPMAQTVYVSVYIYNLCVYYYIMCVYKYLYICFFLNLSTFWYLFGTFSLSPWQGNRLTVHFFLYSINYLYFNQLDLLTNRTVPWRYFIHGKPVNVRPFEWYGIPPRKEGGLGPPPYNYEILISVKQIFKQLQLLKFEEITQLLLL